MKKTLPLLLVFLLCAVVIKAQEKHDLLPPSQAFELNNLDFLKAELNKASVVMLGEPTHGEGNVMEMNIEIIKFLHEKMGFNTIAFESGFYDLYKAQRLIDAGRKVEEVINASIFSIWTKTCEFQELIKYIHDNKAKLKIIGFDSQLTGDYSVYESLVDLQALFKTNNIVTDVDFEMLQHVFISLGEDFSFPKKTQSYKTFFSDMKKIENHLLLLQKRKIADADVWLQFAKSTQQLASDYYSNDPSSYSEANWKASMSNPRDAQMADNLLFFIAKNPKDKVICWGASTHFANNMRSTLSRELMEFKPMGSFLKQKLGAKFYSIATITSSGSYGAFSVSDTIGKLADNSIEVSLSKQKSFYQFVPLQNSPINTPFISHAIDYLPITADWKEVFDAFIFLKSVNHSTYHDDNCTFESQEDSVAENTDNMHNSVHLLQSFTESLSGTLLDENKKPVYFANIIIKNTTIGTVSNENGSFKINYPNKYKQASLLVSCIGYESKEIAIRDFNNSITLQSKDFVLNEVTVNAKNLDPEAILRKAIVNIPNNYCQEDYNAEYYSRGMMTNYDTLLVDVENVVKLYDENGYDNKDNLTSRRIAYCRNVFNCRYFSGPFSVADSPFYIRKVDMVSVSPIFKKKYLNKYILELLGTSEFEGVKVYKIAFKSKYNSYRYTGAWYIEGFTGIVYISALDHSILKVEARWKYNVDKINRTGLYRADDEFISMNVRYKKHINGKYFVHAAKYLRAKKGQVLVSGEKQELKGWQTIFVSKIILNDIDKIPARSYISSDSKKLVKKEQFWNKYNKPLSNE